MVVVALCPRAALENAAQKSSISSFIYRKMRQKGQRSGGSGSGLASGCGGCPSTSPLSLSLALHTRKYVKLLTNFNSSWGCLWRRSGHTAIYCHGIGYASVACIHKWPRGAPAGWARCGYATDSLCMCVCVSLLLVSLCAVSSNWPKSLKGSHAARSACPVGVEDCEREGIEEARLLWQGVKWHCIGQCVVCIVSTNERLWYFGEAFASTGKGGGVRKREQQFRIRFVYCNFCAAVSCGNSCSCTCSITFCCNCELAKFIKFLKGMGAWN